jgi:hypothetical protein
MNISKRLRLALAAAGLLGLSAPASAAINCSLSVTAINLSYVWYQTSTGTGSVTLNCTRSTGDPNATPYYVGIDDTVTGARNVVRHATSGGTADRMAFTLSKASTTTAWTDTGGGRVNGTLNFGGGTSASVTLPFTFRVAYLQFGKSEGIYDALLTATLQLSNNGAVVASTPFTATVSIESLCFVGNSGSPNPAPGTVGPSVLALNYTSFSATPQTGVMGFTVNCTRNTPYTLSLAPATGTLLGLNYSLSLSDTDATGTGLAQPYTVTGTIAAGQSGTCATATCSASQPATITLTY